MNARLFCHLTFAIVLSNVLNSPTQAAEPLFGHEIMAVLSKAGCILGTCHGNQNGKGGFKLSLRGQDPRFDFAALARQHDGRRIDRLQPELSLILLKATGKVTHQGGVRFALDSPEYQLLKDWIAAGAPAHPANAKTLKKIEVQPRELVLPANQSSVPLQVWAFFSDGERRDVTRLATYETSNLGATVRADGVVERQAFGEVVVIVRFLNRQEPVRLAFLEDRPNFVLQHPPAANFVDQHVFAKLKTLCINPSPVVSDPLFVRRAYLDAIGLLPTAEEAQTFCADPAPHKRAALVDQLLHRPEFADHWALKWCDLLRVEEKVLDVKGVQAFHRWIRDSIAAGKPLDQFVHELVAARGSTYENPPANFYRANRDATTRGETTARLFLGTRLQCAQCHNHPFDRWTQDDYYSWSALFARVDYKIVNNNRKDKLDKHEFDGEQIVEVKDSGEVKNARTNKDAAPKFLGAATPSFDAKSDRLAPLAAWLTSRDNERFAESQVNFVWYHLLGRGLVEPIDDFRTTNPASIPQLLKALATEFVEHDFDLRHLVRAIMSSQTYQLSSAPNDTNRADENNFSRAIVRRWPAEKLLDAQCQVLAAPAQFAGYPAGLRAGQIPGVKKMRDRDQPPSAGDRFLANFGKPERLLACECERSNETTLGQAFNLISGDDLNQRLTQSGNRLNQLANSGQANATIVNELFWSALTRPPTRDELSQAMQSLDTTSDRLAALQDLAWALLNAKEFVFRQ